MSANLDAVLFLYGGKPSPLLLAFWKARSPLQTLQATETLLELRGYASDGFRRAWQAAFPDRRPLPDEPVSNPDGRGTVAFWDVFT